MSRKSRIAFAVGVTTILVGLMLFAVINRVMHWQARGFTGLAYVQVMRDGKAAPNVFPVKPGHVMMVYPGGPARDAGIRSGDEVLSINGIAVRDAEALRGLSDRLKTGDVVTYELRRDSKTRTVPVGLVAPWPNRWMVSSVVVFSIVAAAFITIGLLVFSRAPTDRRSTVFYAMVTVGALSLLGNMMAAVDVGTMRGILADAEPNLIALALLAFFSLSFFPLTLHLALVFPKDRPALVRNPLLLRWVYGLPLLAILVSGTIMAVGMSALRRPGRDDAFVEFIFKWGTAGIALAGLLVALRIARKARTEGFRNAFWFRPSQSLLAAFGLLLAISRIVGALKWKGMAVAVAIATVAVPPLLVVIGYPILSCVLLYRSYREAGVEERRQVKWPLWGTLIAIGSKIIFSTAMYGLMFGVLATGGDLSEWMGATMMLSLLPILLYLLIPISFAFAILKYRLMNIDVIIKKTVVYAILSTAIIILYLVLVGGLGTVLIAVAGVQNQTMVIASTLVVALLFVPLRNRLQHLVDRNLFRQKFDYPQALRAIAADTMTASDINTFLEGAAEKLQQALQNRSVVMFQRRGDTMVATAKVGVADSVLGTATISMATAESFDRPLDPRRRELPEADAAAFRKLQTAMVLPVRSGGAATGVVALAAKLSDRDFDLEDIEFASSAADQIAIGIDRIRAQHDEADFEQARALQQTLLPTEAPRLTGVDVAGVWQPARTVGGDYYDLIKLSETQLGMCIGDVAGKGMPAALLMSALQAAVRASADPDVAPSRVCERVRRVVVPSLGTRFVTFFYCTYDTVTRRLRYCNAGHNPPVVVRADGTTERLSTGGAVLSRFFRNETLLDAEIDLGIGDRVVLFTDGVSEARDTAENDFSEERLEKLVAANRSRDAEDLAATIVAAVSAYAGGRTDDDLTLVTLAVTG